MKEKQRAVEWEKKSRTEQEFRGSFPLRVIHPDIMFCQHEPRYLLCFGGADKSLRIKLVFWQEVKIKI